MEVNFKYNIGDIVTHKAYALEGDRQRDALRLVIVGRLMDECPGGMQKHYRCRAVSVGSFSGGMVIQPVQLHEEELVPFPTQEAK